MCPKCKQADCLKYIGYVGMVTDYGGTWRHYLCTRCDLVLYDNGVFSTYGYCGSPEEHKAEAL